MGSLFKKHPVAVILSVVFHLVLVAFFVFGFDFFNQPVEPKPAVNIVKATVIDDSKVRAAVEQLKKLELNKKTQEKKRQEKLKAERKKEEKKLADLKKKQAEQTKKIKDQKVAEAARLAKLKKQEAEKLKKKAADDKRKKADLAKKKALDKKKNDAALKRKKAEDKKKQEAELKRKKAEDEKKRAEQEQAENLAAMMEAAREEEQERLAQKAIASFSDVIRQKVERNWIQPAGSISELSCVVRVQLIPGGEVGSAKIIKSSGNKLFDRSVELATRKASPLPIPDDPALFKYFRNLEFDFNPGE